MRPGWLIPVAVWTLGCRGPTEVRELSEITDAAARAVGDYVLTDALDGAGVALPVDSLRVAFRTLSVDCTDQANDGLVRRIGVTGYVTLSEVNQQSVLVLDSYGRRCNDSTFTGRQTIVGQYVLQDRFLTILTGLGGFGNAVTGEVDPAEGVLRLNLGRPGLLLFRTFGAVVQELFVTELVLRRRPPG